MNNVSQSFWRRCGSCKKEIPYNSEYQACGVSGCQKFAYCSIDCWSLHNSIMNHKSGWCEDRVSPKSDANDIQSTPVKRIIVSNAKPQESSLGQMKSSENDSEILIVASKLKQYIKDKHDLNTSADVMEALSSIVRRLTDQAVIKAKSDNRKTLMKRDF